MLSDYHTHVRTYEYSLITKFFGLHRTRRLRFRDRESYSGNKTKEYDDLAMKYLSYVLFLLVACSSAYSLKYERHKSWYSWILSSLISCVDMFAVQRAPAPAPASSGGGSMLGGLGSTIAQGMSFGTRTVAHKAVDSVMGPRTIQHEVVPATAAAATQYKYKSKSI